MPVTRRNKNLNQEDFLSLSLVKKSKPVKRTIEVADDSINVAKKQKRCRLRRNRVNEEVNVNNVSISSDHNDDTEVLEFADDLTNKNVDIGLTTTEVVDTDVSFDCEINDDVVNDELDVSISEEIELVGGELVMDFEDENEQIEDDDMNVKNKRNRGQNKVYILVEEFENKDNFDEYWNEMEFSKIYYHHVSKTTNEGMEDIFRCKNVNKRGFEKCQMQCKVVFPGCDMSARLYITNDEHKHGRKVDEEVSEKFTWRSQVRAEEIVKLGVEHNDYPSQIMKALNDAGISPMPEYLQLNNKIARLRLKIGNSKNISTSGELEEELKKYTKIPDADDIHKPFVKDYKIEILSCGRKARFWFNITTHNLLKRIATNVGKLFQIDGTYKLIWIPEKGKEGWCVQVHGTSNILNEFFPTGICVTSEESAKTYKEIFNSLDNAFKYLMADGARAITLAKNMSADDDDDDGDDEEVPTDNTRLMCWPHVFRAISKKLKSVPKEAGKNILDDISAIQLSQSRKEFDKVNELFLVKWLETGNETIDTFVAYYNLQWVQSPESNWFVGAGPVDHNNGIEGTNEDIKKTKVIRDKQKLAAFTSNALDIVEGWSRKDDSRLNAAKADLISLKHQTDGFQWLMQNQKNTSVLKLRGKYYVLASNAKHLDIKEVVKNFVKNNENLEYSDGFDEWRHTRGSLYELSEDGDFFKCSCPLGSKKYFCKHNIGLAIKFKNLQIPDSAKSVPLNEKRTRGRPAKNRGWWSHQ